MAGILTHGTCRRCGTRFFVSMKLVNRTPEKIRFYVRREEPFDVIPEIQWCPKCHCDLSMDTVSPGEATEEEEGEIDEPT